VAESACVSPAVLSALHELPRSAECYREAPNQYEGEIIDQIDVMGMQNERYG